MSIIQNDHDMFAGFDGVVGQKKNFKLYFSQMKILFSGQSGI